MWLFIEPLDVLLFRDGKSFAAGEGFWARGNFPPSPLPFAGAIRALLLSRALADAGLTFGDYRSFVRDKSSPSAEKVMALQPIIDKFGGADDYGQLQIRGPFICQRGRTALSPYFPLPLDVMLQENELTQSVLLQPRDFPVAVQWGGPQLQLLLTDKRAVAPEPTMLSFDSANLYLCGQTAFSVGEVTLWDAELQVGIELSGKRAAVEGMLYSAELTRLRNIIFDANGTSAQYTPSGFLLEVKSEGADEAAGQGLDALLTKGLIALGGRSRAANYEKVGEAELPEDFKELLGGEELKAQLKGQDRFKLCLLTPAIFTNGWLPDFIDAGSYEGQIDDLEFKLVAAAVGKAMPIGGWDLARNKPRKMWQAAPVGSVYFFKLKSGQLDEQSAATLLQRFHLKSLQGVSVKGKAVDPHLSEFGKAGLGLAVVGLWAKEES